jgi:hypothetical protein
VQAYAIALELAAQRLTRLRLVLRQQVVLGVDQVHLAAESAKCLGKFAAQWPASQYHQPPRELGQRKDGFVG